MKLERIRVEQLRQFREPFELAGLQPGLNVFAGPNEAGKSTLVRALRAAFFERYRSNSVDDLRPREDAAASPSVEIDFAAGGTDYRLRKTFLRRHRCELFAGARRLEGEDAERELAQLLGYDYAQRGASKEEHWGIPGLLWIEQGATHRIHDPVKHATDYLRNALGQSVTEIASSRGDDVIERVRRERAKLLTATGQQTGDYRKAIDAIDAARERLQALDDRTAQYRRQVDELEALRLEDAAQARAKPWEADARAADEARTKLVELNTLRDRVASNAARIDPLQKHAMLLQQKLDSHEAARAASRDREEALAKAKLEAERAEASVARWTAEQAIARADEQRAAAVLAAVRDLERRGELARRVQDLTRRIGETEDRLSRAQAHQARVLELRRLAAASFIEPEFVSTLRNRHEALRDLRMKQAAMATRIVFDLRPDARLTLDGETLAERGERLLTVPARLDIADVGSIAIQPGGTDLAELARDLARCEDDIAASLRSIGAASLEEVEERRTKHEDARRDATHTEKLLQTEAPRGIDALRTECEEMRVQRETAEAQWASLPSAPAEGSDVPSPADAKMRHDTALQRLADVESQLVREQHARTAAASRAEAAARELALARARIEDPKRAEEEQQDFRALESARSELATLTREVSAQRDQLARAHPDILEQDVERFRRSAELAQRAFSDRQGRMLLLQGQLENAGAEGIEEERAGQAALVEAATRRLSELRLQAQALDLLLKLLEAKRAELTRRLQSPLRRHLDRYLQLLFPGATLELGEDLVPQRITRKEGSTDTSGDVESLSYGAREQMGVITRLAYADLLREAGRPTLIILDDALVHSDDHRLAQMKRVLFDAAHRHQVLLFTCHPEAWRDLGVAPRRIGRDAMAG